MLSRPVRLATRASAGARARSAASVTQVWDVLAHPDRWSEFEPLLRSIGIATGTQPSDGPGAAEDALHVELAEEGQELRGYLRFWPLPVPIRVDHVVTRSSIAVTSKLLPGLAEEVEHLVIPSAAGGSMLTVRLTLHGPLALPALLPRWFARAVTLRLLARAAEERLRQERQEASSVA